MAGQNGATVLIKIKTNTGTFEFISGQAKLKISDKTKQIDVSDKLSGRLGEKLPGRATATLSIDCNFQRTDAVIGFLKTEYRNRREVEVLIFDRANLDAVTSVSAITGTAIESCKGFITDLSETHPDQDRSEISLEVELNNDWVPVA